MSRDGDIECATCGKAMRLHGRFPEGDAAHGVCPAFKPTTSQTGARIATAPGQARAIMGDEYERSNQRTLELVSKLIEQLPGYDNGNTVNAALILFAGLIRAEDEPITHAHALLDAAWVAPIVRHVESLIRPQYIDAAAPKPSEEPS